MLGIKFYQCYYCNEEFRKGTGHLTMCFDCGDSHSMCESCYRTAKKNNKIQDLPKMKKTDIHPKLLEMDK